MSLVIDNRQEAIEVDDQLVALLERTVEESLDYEGWDPDYEVSLSLVDNKEIHSLNKYYRGKDCPTDVLSFPMVEEESLDMEEKLLGDIVISVEKAIEQSQEYGHSLSREMSFLVVHSMFHLMGYDHGNQEEEAEMRSKEEAVLKVLGQVR